MCVMPQVLLQSAKAAVQNRDPFGPSETETDQNLGWTFTSEDLNCLASKICKLLPKPNKYTIQR